MFHRLRLAYNRVPKSGNSSTLMYLAELERQQDLPQTLGSFDDYLAAKALAHSATRPPRLRDVGPRFLGFGGNLRWCTVVRHPYTRLVSAFLQKRDRLADGVNGYQRFPGLANPSLSAGFSEFVGYLHNDGTGGNKHWIPQTEMLSLAPNDFDYLIYLENFACQFRSLVRDLGFEPGDNAYSEPHRAERGVKVTNAKQVAHLLITADLKKKIDALYHQDFVALGYQKDFNFLPNNSASTGKPSGLGCFQLPTGRRSASNPQKGVGLRQ